jgi:hypothetical protein
MKLRFSRPPAPVSPQPRVNHDGQPQLWRYEKKRIARAGKHRRKCGKSGKTEAPMPPCSHAATPFVKRGYQLNRPEMLKNRICAQILTFLHKKVIK